MSHKLFSNEPKARIAYETIATSSHPAIGTIGLTEPDAKKEFGEENIEVKQFLFSSLIYMAR